MTVELITQTFNKGVGYIGNDPALLLSDGELSDGLNVRKSLFGKSWKGRKGCELFNTTALESGTAIKSLHQYDNFEDEFFFIAQVNSKLYRATNDPPTTGTTFGTDMGVTVGTTAGFSAVVNGQFFYADGSGAPVTWRGTLSRPLAFFAYDNSESAYVDHTINTRDGSSSTKGLILSAADDVFYVLTHEKCEGVTFDLGSTVNSNSITITCAAWRGASGWVNVSGQSDGTASGGVTLAQDGAITWTRSTSDEAVFIEGYLGYAYKFSVSGALSGNVDVLDLTVSEDPDTMTAKWDGQYAYCANILFYDASANQYIEYLAKLSNTSQSQILESIVTTSDAIYIKTIEPITAISFSLTDESSYDANSDNMVVKYWDGDSFTSVGTLTDKTKYSTFTLRQTGVVHWDASQYTPYKTTIGGDVTPGFWYQISVDTSGLADRELFMILVVPYAEPMQSANGCIGHKERLMLWGNPIHPDRIQFSAPGFPDCLSGVSAGFTDSFGARVQCAVPFYNELLVFTKTSVWLMEGYDINTFGLLKVSPSIGTIAPKSVCVAEVGHLYQGEREPMTVVFWIDSDGVYILDGRKPRKISSAVNHYFDPDSSDCIAAADLDDIVCFIDRINNEYHIVLPSGGELVYNFMEAIWYPPWSRELDLVCGESIRSPDNRIYTLGGTSGGFVCLLENDTTDKDASNNDVVITHTIKTKAIGANDALINCPKSWLTVKANTSGTLTVKKYVNLESTGTSVVLPEVPSISSTDGLITPFLNPAIENCICFQLEITAAIADLDFELFSVQALVERTHIPDV